MGTDGRGLQLGVQTEAHVTEIPRRRSEHGGQLLASLRIHSHMIVVMSPGLGMGSFDYAEDELHRWQAPPLRSNPCGGCATMRLHW